MKTNERLEENLGFLGAMPLHFDDEGDVTQYFYFAEESGEFWKFSPEEAAELDLSWDGGYSHWCVQRGERMSREEAESLKQAAANAGDMGMVDMCNQHLANI